jgi:ATP-dependent Lon protease
VGACNIRDIRYILPPLRSRIQGEGYEILMRTTMSDTPENQAKLAQFMAQEIKMDGKIPHATRTAVGMLLIEARRRAKVIDDQKNSLTLRLRDLGGVVRMAGDMAVMEGKNLIEEKHMSFAIKKSLSIEDQIIQRYKTFENAMQRDYSSAQHMSDRDNQMPNENVDRSYM